MDPHIVAAVVSGRLVPRRAADAAFIPKTDGSAGMSPGRAADGWCGFRVDRRCSLQDSGGEAMLPSGCRHFPRVIRQDAREVRLTLSHYCPTAAAMLLADGPVTIMDVGPPLALTERIEGLDARNALPPLVRPGLLADLDGYAAWEDAVVFTLARATSIHAALARITTATEDVRRWTPDQGPLAARVAKAFAPDPSSRPDPSDPSDLSDPFWTIRQITGPHPLLAVPPHFPRAWAAVEAHSRDWLRRPLAKYMAACAFGNWTAYRGQGLRSVVAWLRGCYDVLRLQLVRHAENGRLNAGRGIEAFRMADLILVHNVPSMEFGREAVIFESDTRMRRKKR